MSNRFLVEQFADWQRNGERLVLVTVMETAGSTYSKAGRQLLINEHNRYAGLVGGGCLEGDLVLRARDVLEADSPALISYDMRDDADDLWGMGAGCRGLMRLLLQPLHADNNWEPFASIAVVMSGKTARHAMLSTDGDFSLSQDACPPAPALVAGVDGTATLHWTIRPWPRLLILGAGPDANPLITMAHALGWQCTVADHRPERVNAAAMTVADQCLLVLPDSLDEQLRLDAFDAVVVMSHHLETDRQYLRALSQYRHDYAGVLGPAARRNELLAQLELLGTEFAERLRGPVGLDIHADSPPTIALAVLAEIQTTLNS